MAATRRAAAWVAKHADVVGPRVIAARAKLFGQVEPGGLKAGRKVARQALKGPALDSWYPYTMKELKAPGYDEPAIEDLYRMEQELNRVGKTRAEGKIKPLRVDVVERIKIADFNMEVVNWDRLDGEEGDAAPDADVDPATPPELKDLVPVE